MTSGDKGGGQPEKLLLPMLGLLSLDGSMQSPCHRRLQTSVACNTGLSCSPARAWPPSTSRSSTQRPISIPSQSPSRPPSHTCSSLFRHRCRWKDVRRSGKSITRADFFSFPIHVFPVARFEFALASPVFPRPSDQTTQSYLKCYVTGGAWINVFPPPQRRLWRRRDVRPAH